MKEKTKKKIEKKMSAFLATRLAMRKDEAEKLASVNFDLNFKDNGEPECPNSYDVREDGIAVIHVDGGLSYRTDLWTAWFGMDTYNSIEAAFDECLGNPKVKGIVFDINSPGGEVSGCADLAEKIYKARGTKEFGIVARTGGLMCSAAYWLGSACEKVYTASNGTLGSIGVLCAYDKRDDENVSVIVSDYSPNKVPKPDDDEGLKLIKQELNDLAEVFIKAVAEHRHTTEGDVRENFGKGGVFIGQKAVDAKLADCVMSLEEIFEQMKNGETVMTEEQKSEVLAEYKKSISAVKALFDECGIQEDAMAFVDGGKTLADAKDYAFDKLKAEKKTMAEGAAKDKAESEEKIKALESDVAAKAEELEKVKAELAKAPAPDANLTGSQKLAVQKGLEAEAAAQNSVQGGNSAKTSTEAKAFSDAWSRGAKLKH
ncbi:S49 family peptidase [Fibrobacter sp.]|uniref:S49 family peptidase n=1 Tax=Fibrobacter sp. TaxID=35828 RepID=UPI00388FA5F4